VNEYIKKLLNKLFNPSWALKDRGDFMEVYGLTEDEYLNGIVDFEVNGLKKLEGQFFDTTSYPYSGGYDFLFKVTEIGFIQYTKASVSLDHSIFGEMIRIYVEIEKGGTVDLIEDGETKPVIITDDLIMNSDVGWEIEGEIKETIMDMILTEESNLFNNIRTYDIIELYIYFPEE
jgi:hypothetical protein